MGCVTNCTVLLVDDEVEMCLSLADVLNAKGYTTHHTTNPLDVPHILERERIDLIIMDIKMPQMGGIDLLKSVKHHNPALPVIMMTGYPTIENAVRAMKYGAVNVYTKPLNLPELVQEIQELAAKFAKKRARSQDSRYTIITKDPAMHAILEMVENAAPTAVPVLITGESGTGKELVAHSLHHLSPRSEKPLIKVNCAALPEDLLESELFGHEKGAFTGALKQSKGRFEQADTGSIFLDEIGDMSLKTQAKILRVIQEQEFSRVGGAAIIRTDSRIIAATNKDMRVLIEQGLFREDLYYRLSVITFQLPPLRKRPQDVMLLVDHFLAHYNQVYHKEIAGVSDEMRWFFCSHAWPGNVRELKNCIERAVIFCQGDTIDVKNLAAQYKEMIDNPPSKDYEDVLEDINREIVLNALNKSKGVKKKAAELLKIDRRTLYNRMKKLGIE